MDVSSYVPKLMLGALAASSFLTGVGRNGTSSSHAKQTQHSDYLGR